MSHPSPMSTPAAPAVDPRPLWAMSRAALAGVAAGGHPIDPERLAGAAYRGVSLGLPVWLDRALWKVFRKRFDRDSADPDVVVGHNVRVEQPAPGALAPLGVDAGPEPLRRAGRPIVFGPFRVVHQTGPNPAGTRAGLVLDYAATHPTWHPMARVRDVLVAIAADDARVLLGAMYLELGGVKIGTPSWFTLEREPDGP